MHTEVFYEQLKIGDQIAAAAAKGARCIIIVGETELAKGEVIIKNLTTKEQKIIPLTREAVMDEISNYY